MAIQEITTFDCSALLKRVLLLCCFGGFILTTWKNLESYTKKQTVMVSEVITNPGIPLPALTFCNFDGYKYRANKTSSDLDAFSKKTYSLDELMVVDEASQNMTKTTFSRLRGRCYTHYDHQKIMGGSTYTYFEILPSKRLIIYAHEPGEEFWFAYNYFPELVDLVYLSKDTWLFDLQVQKEETNQLIHCQIGWTTQNYTECIRRRFNEAYHELGIGCTLPWVQSHILKETGEKVKYCQGEDAIRLDAKMNEFLEKASMYNIDTCLKPCTQVRYRLQAESYSHLSMAYSYVNDTGYRYISAFYGDSAVVKRSEVPIFTPASFLSAVGGGLGLFLGWSLASAAKGTARLVANGGEWVKKILP